MFFFILKLVYLMGLYKIIKNLGFEGLELLFDLRFLCILELL